MNVSPVCSGRRGERRTRQKEGVRVQIGLGIIQREERRRGQHTVSLLTNVRKSRSKMLSDVADKVILLARLLGQDLLPELAGLRKVILRHLSLEVNHGSAPILLGGSRVLGRGREVLEAGWVVRCSTAQALGVERAVATQGVEAVLGTVNGQLDEVGAKAVALGVLVCESPELENCQSLSATCKWMVDTSGWHVITWIRGKGPTWDHIGRTECNLLSLGEVVSHILVQHDATKGTVGEVLGGQSFGGIEDVDGVVLGNIGADDLTIDVPGGEFSSLYVVMQRTGHVVRVLSGKLLGLSGSKVLVALVRLDVELDIRECSILFR